MNELELLTTLRCEVPETAPPAHAELILAAAMADEAAGRGARDPGRPAPAAAGWGWRRTARSWRPGVALGTGLALAAGAAAAAGVLATRTAPGAAARGGTSTPVIELAYRAAAAAASQPAVRPGQWVYWREMQSPPMVVAVSQSGSAQRPTSVSVFQVWTTANSHQAAYLRHGKVTYLRCASLFGGLASHPGGTAHCAFEGQPEALPAGFTSALVAPHPAVSYADLASLPASPRALARYLEHFGVHGRGGGPGHAFSLIGEILRSYVTSPALTAELYRAIPYIPGIRVDREAVDVAGRHGVAFTLPRHGGWRQEVILNPATFRFMGWDEGVLRGGRLHMNYGYAVLRRAFVSGPGVAP